MCVWNVVCWCVGFYRGAEPVVMRMTRLGKDPLSAPRTPLPPYPIYPINFRITSRVVPVPRIPLRLSLLEQDLNEPL